MEFISANNKGMIWGLLQESNIFNGIENEKFANIQSLFEETIRSININNQRLSLLEKNKLTMETLMQQINDEKSKPKKTIQVVYKAEDLQNKRTEDFNMKLKQQQDSMNSMMNVSKPKEVTFSDETDGDDKPIGDEMDRLISERMASRERELEIPVMTQETETWLNTSNTTNTTNTSNTTNTTNNEFQNKTEPIITKKKSSGTSDIFSKLKRKTENILINSQSNNSNDIGVDVTIKEEILKIRSDQEIIKQTCLHILEILQQGR
jgi:hypothetical protein